MSTRGWTKTNLGPLLLLLPPQLLLPRFELLGTRLKNDQPGHEDQRRHEQRVDDDGHHEAVAPRDGAADDVLVLIAIVEVEMNQEIYNYSFRAV